MVTVRWSLWSSQFFGAPGLGGGWAAARRRAPRGLTVPPTGHHIIRIPDNNSTAPIAPLMDMAMQLERFSKTPAVEASPAVRMALENNYPVV